MTGLFEILFGRRKPVITRQQALAPQNAETMPVKKDLPSLHLSPVQLISACAQSVGLQREHNEDALFLMTTMLSSDHNELPFGLYVVADGMGGHQYGEIASNIAVRSTASHVIGKLYTSLLKVIPSSPDESLQDVLREAVQDAHRMILKDAPGGGTTLTAVLVLGGQLTVAHVGDSRAYLVALDGSIHPLTRDHSLVRRLVELGQISEEEASVHPQRNVLYRALGQGEPFEPDITTQPIPKSGYLMICSDGLWGVISEESISEIILAEPIPEKACQRLIEAANKAGGPDNITVILVRLPE